MFQTKENKCGIEGHMKIEFRDQVIDLSKGEIFVVNVASNGAMFSNSTLVCN